MATRTGNVHTQTPISGTGFHNIKYTQFILRTIRHCGHKRTDRQNKNKEFDYPTLPALSCSVAEKTLHFPDSSSFPLFNVVIFRTSGLSLLAVALQRSSWPCIWLNIHAPWAVWRPAACEPTATPLRSSLRRWLRMLASIPSPR